jgi:hypothetical protein
MILDELHQTIIATEQMTGSKANTGWNIGGRA